MNKKWNVWYEVPEKKKKKKKKFYKIIKTPSGEKK